jgi:uncharacterized membrane protein
VRRAALLLIAALLGLLAFALAFALMSAAADRFGWFGSLLCWTPLRTSLGPAPDRQRSRT